MWAIAPVVLTLCSCAVDNPLFGLDGSGGSGDGTGGENATGSDEGIMNETGVDEGSGGGSGSATSGMAADGVVFRDDEWPSEFADGVMERLEWDTNHLRVAGDATDGVFTSRVFDAGETMTWDSIKWGPAAPYGKPLPDDGLSETAYMFGNADMTDIHQLLHFDSPELTAVFMDSSGHGHDAQPSGSSELSVVEGQFGRAVYVETLLGTIDLHSELFDPVERDFTWSFWYRADGCRGDALITYDSLTNAEGTPAIWMTCTSCMASHGIAVGAYGPEGNFTCVALPVGDGNWHHIALVKEGHATASVTGYFDGSPFTEIPVTFDIPLVSEPDVELLLGGHPRGEWPGRGEFDELAIWHHALEQPEVRALYERGAHQMRLRARACDDPDCGGVEYVGPGADTARWYSDAGTNPAAPGPLPLIDVSGRYAQYQVELEGGSPQLHAVELSGFRP